MKATWWRGKEPLLSRLSTAAFLLASVLYVVGSWRKVQALFGPWKESVEHFGPAMIAGIVAAGLFFWALKSMAASLAAEKRENELVPEVTQDHRLQLAVQMALSAVIFLRAVQGLNAAFDWDEIERVCQMVQGNFWYVLNPTTTLNHPVATAASIVSSLIWGDSKVGFRLPSLAFTLLFLGVLNWFALRFLSRMTSLLLFTHLALSSMVTWYLHSLRGYVSMMGFSLLALGLVWDLVRKNFQTERFTLPLLLSTFVLLIFSHGFGGVFAVCLTLAIFVDLYLRRSALASEALRRGLDLFFMLAGVIALCGLVFVLQVYKLDKTYGFLFAAPVSSLDLTYKLGRLTMILGTSALWVGKGVFFLAVVGLFCKWRESRRLNQPLDFLSVFVMSSVVFILASFYLLEVSILEGRMLLAFLVPALAFISEGLMKANRGFSRVGWVSSLALLLVIPPVIYGKGLLKGDLDHFAAHESFAAKVLEKIGGDTPKSCVSFSGEPRAIFYSQHYYFRHLKNEGDCSQEYLVHYGVDLFQKKYPLAESGQLGLILSDHEGRSLYRAGDRNQLARLEP